MVGRRSDAELNRLKILLAGVTALGESSDATMNAIARRAGVGQGTMYRHFPTREALLLAVSRQDVQAVVDAAPVLLAEYPPDQALRRWFGRLASYGRIKHGVAQAVEAATRADLSSDWYGPVSGAITLLLEAGQAAGQIRGDGDADEGVLLVGVLWRLDNHGWGKQRAPRSADVIGGVVGS